MNEKGDLTFEEMVGFSFFQVIHFINHLDFKKVIPGTEGSQLVFAPFNGSFTQDRRIGALHGPLILRSFQVFSATKTFFYGPGSPFNSYFGLFAFG